MAASAAADMVPFDADRWAIGARESRIADHLGRRSLYLKAGDALVKGASFTDGVIEFDMAFGPERGFMGAVWRAEDSENCENFYIRPHQSGNPDANQYQPVFNGVAAWQLYHGERYGAPTRYAFDQWVHFKIVVSGKSAEFYIDDMDKPVLRVEQKREIQAGTVGLSVGNFAGAYFSNFRFEAGAAPPLRGGAPKPESAPPGAIRTWRVSGTFAAKSLDGKHELSAEERRVAGWTALAAEGSGIANLARVQGIGEGRDTAFARATIRSERAQVKKLRLGFSDAVKVFLNDRALYGGRDAYQSRDYRFLGSVGLFDEVYLPLRQGDNELWLAVTEGFGGWGVIAAFDDLDGMTIAE
ncbi:MAG TPA: hypothetical protein VFM88_04420 [Vicinamibacteria bacterium]|nr:hypothetical protein [Vicinamibacteria bacterium]